MEQNNIAFLFGIHGSIQDILEKTNGDYKRVSEFFIIKKMSKEYDNVFVFSHDKKRFKNLFPDNTYHYRLFNQILFLSLGWIILLFSIHKKRIRWVYLESSALPLIFIINRFSNAKVLLNYNYLLYKVYETERNPKSFKNILSKNRFMPFFVRVLEKSLIRYVDYIIAASKEIERFVPKAKVLNYRIGIRKGIIIREFRPDKTKKHKIFTTIIGPTVLSTSRLTKMKNPFLLLRAYEIAKRRIPDLNLIFAGEGDLMDECRKISDSDVYFLGFERNIPSLLKGADVFVLSSLYDPSPRSLIEAMAMGTPSIATNVGGVSDYLDDTCGILIEPGNPEKLANKIEYIIKNKKIARILGKRARNKILKYHDLEKNMNILIDFMKKNI